MRRAISIISILAFSFNLLAYTGGFNEGLKYLKMAKKARMIGNDEDEKNYLTKAYEIFKEDLSRESKFLQVYTGALIEKDDEIESVAEGIVKKHREDYSEFVTELGYIDEEAKRGVLEYLEEIEDKIPFIERIKVAKEEIYPYRGGKPGITFSLNTKAHMNMKVDGNEEEMSSSYPEGENEAGFTWRDYYVLRRHLDLELKAKNAFSEYERFRRMLIDISKPMSLYYKNNEFGLQGKEFKSETKIKKRIDPLFLLLGIIHIVGGSIGTVSGKSEYVWLIIGGGLFSTIGLTNGKEVTIPDLENISYNKQLKKEISEKKKNIKVKMKISKEEEKK